MSKNTTVTHNGVGFFSLLFIALLVLKLMGHVDIGWLALFAILFAPLLIYGAVVVVVFAFAAVAALLNR